MKKFLSVLLAGAMVLGLTACSGETSSSSSEVASDSSDNVAESVDSSFGGNAADTDVVVDGDGDAVDDSFGGNAADADVVVDDEIDYSSLSDEEIYDLMVKRSLMTTGDMTRMANVLKKAENGEEITVAYIGGSITEGLTVSYEHPELCWAYLTYEWLCEQYPDTKINYVNAGISGTPSILGNLRLERDVLAYTPDICFVEFAVNDGTETAYKNNYESLVRTLLEQENDMAVVLLFTVIKSGHTCQPQMSQVGENYNLPMISEPNSLGVELSEGRMTWEEYSDDESHPNLYGHTVVRDFVVNYYETVMASIDENVGEVDNTLPDPVFSDRYQDMHYIDSEKLDVELVNFYEDNAHDSFPNGWSYKGDETASMKFTITCKSLEMIYKANDSKAYADADIYVDGEKVLTVSSNRSDGWANPETVFLIDEDEVSEHTVEIVVEGGDKHYFGVLGFGYCD